MLEALLHVIQSTMLAAGPLGVFFLAILQEVIPPIPSTLVTVSAGFVLLAGEPFSLLTFWHLFYAVGIPVAAGLTLGSLVIYGIVYWGGRPTVERYGRFVGVSWSDIERLQEHMRGHVTDDVLLFAARAFPLMPSIAINVACGIVRWRIVPFVLHTFFGTIVRAMWSGFIGWQFSALYMRYASVVEGGQNVVLGVLVILAAVFLYYRRKRSQPRVEA